MAQLPKSPVYECWEKVVIDFVVQEPERLKVHQCVRKRRLRGRLRLVWSVLEADLDQDGRGYEGDGDKRPDRLDNLRFGAGRRHRYKQSGSENDDEADHIGSDFSARTVLTASF